MFYYIIGDCEIIDSNTAVIEAGGVGYKLAVSANTLGKLASLPEGKKAKLYTYMNVKEDAVDLFGFFDEDELKAFKLLISVSGVGAKSAISVLSFLTPDGFARAVSSGDSKAIARAQGIGAKTAARIALELKDKVAKSIPSSASEAGAAQFIEADVGGDEYTEAMNALLLLGYSRTEASHALRGLDASALGIENLIREALAKLMKQ